jgi:YesN/AraC family two-component response regulator
MAMLLEMNGHEVRIAHNGESALAIAETFHPDVVVSDIKLPDMDGFKLARALRQLNGMDKTKFIALSGYAESEFPNPGIKFHHFLHKPVKVEELEMILAN